jgi:hypothetical protein
MRRLKPASGRRRRRRRRRRSITVGLAKALDVFKNVRRDDTT